MNESFVTVVGNLVADPILRTSKHGKHFATFRVASTTRRRDPASGAFVDSGTNYVSVVVFNGLAANVVASFKKGEPVIVYGRLRVNQWVGSQNQHMTSVEVEGYNAGHDLTWGQTKFAKLGRAQFDTGDRLGDPEIQASLHVDELQGSAAAEPDSDGSGEGARYMYPDPPDPQGFDRTIEDAETDPYEVVNSG